MPLIQRKTTTDSDRNGYGRPWIDNESASLATLVYPFLSKSAVVTAFKPTPIILRWKETEPTMRYAAYVRTNHLDETGSADLAAQQAAVQAWIAAQGGILTAIYSEVASGSSSAHRPALAQMQTDAKQGKFDALVVHKPDRLSRNQTELLAIRSLLVEDYRIRLFSVTEQDELDTQYQQQAERRYAAA
jgi:hypothetical protein